MTGLIKVILYVVAFFWVLIVALALREVRDQVPGRMAMRSERIAHGFLFLTAMFAGYALFAYAIPSPFNPFIDDQSMQDVG